MNRISVAITGSYGSSGYKQKYMPLLQKLDSELCKAYGVGFPRNYSISDEPIEKMCLTKIPSRLSAFVVKPLSKVFHYPQYYTYWSGIRMMDEWIASRLKDDPSEILFTLPVYPKTVTTAKKLGKIVIVEAGNSEPAREHARISAEYDQYGIKNQYIYGNPSFRDAFITSYSQADHIVSISKVSMETYRNAGYDMSKFQLISLAGTDMPIQPYSVSENTKKAFITTAFHNFIKGTHRLLNAWEKADTGDIPLLVVGSLCEDMQEYIKKHGPFENVEFIGHRSDLKEWYKQYDAVGVLMSLSEGAGRVTPEMMSFGFPMITSADATCDLVRDAHNGFIVDCFDEDALAARLTWFAEDWSRVYAMRENVLNSVSSRSVRDYSLELADYLLSLL